MQPHRLPTLLLLAALGLVTLALAWAGYSGAQPGRIVVINAGSVITTTTAFTQGLPAAIAPRVFVQYATQVAVVRPNFDFGTLNLFPADVSERIWIQYADSNQVASLSYPLALMGTRTPTPTVTPTPTITPTPISRAFLPLVLK